MTNNVSSTSNTTSSTRDKESAVSNSPSNTMTNDSNGRSASTDEPKPDRPRRQNVADAIIRPNPKMVCKYVLEQNIVSKVTSYGWKYMHLITGIQNDDG